MKKIVMLALILFPLYVALQNTALAVSPMPEEIEKGISEKPTDTVCSVKITYMNNANGAPLKEDFSYSAVFEGSMPKKEALDKTMRSVEDKLKEGDISSIKIECRFPELKAKEK